MKNPDNEKRKAQLLWVFYVSKGIEDPTDLMRCEMLIMEIIGMEDPTPEKIKNTMGYRSCINDIPDQMLSDEYLQEIIDWEL